MVSIFIAKTTQEADLIIGMLKNNGIIAEKSATGGLDFMQWYSGTSVYSQDILVAKDSAEKAKSLVEAFFKN